MDNKWWVYKHTNLMNGKSYIGISSKFSPNKRWSNGNGYKLQPKFWRAICKYGWDGFSHEILYFNLSKEEAINKEIELILQFNSIQKGYNTTKGGEGTCGFHHSFESKYKIGKAHKGIPIAESTRKAVSISNKTRKISNETRQKHSKASKGHKVSEELIAKLIEIKSKEVLQIDKKGNVIACFKSAVEASKHTGILYSSITACCRKETKTAKNFIWRFKENYDKNEDFKELLTHKSSKPIAQYSKTEELINIFSCLREAEEKTGISQCCINDCCRKKQKTAGGFVWAYYLN